MRPTEEGRGTRGRIERRTLLLAGAASVTLAGCSLNNPFGDRQDPAAEPVRELAPDVAVAVEAVTLLLAAGAAVAATAVAHPALSKTLAGLAAAHTAHVDALRAAVPERVDLSAEPTSYVVPTTRGRALAAVRTSEVSLQNTLVALAVRAESGQFARLLGTMSAAVAQQLAVVAR